MFLLVAQNLYIIFQMSLVLQRLCFKNIQNKILISLTFIGYDLENNKLTQQLQATQLCVDASITVF